MHPIHWTYPECAIHLSAMLDKNIAMGYSTSSIDPESLIPPHSSTRERLTASPRDRGRDMLPLMSARAKGSKEYHSYSRARAQKDKVMTTEWSGGIPRALQAPSAFADIRWDGVASQTTQRDRDGRRSSREHRESYLAAGAGMGGGGLAPRGSNAPFQCPDTHTDPPTVFRAETMPLPLTVAHPWEWN